MQQFFSVTLPGLNTWQITPNQGLCCFVSGLLHN